jgi:hypothetical protein
MDIKSIDLSELREMWRQRREAVASLRKRINPTGMTRPPRDPDEAAFLKERGLEGPFVEVERPGWREWANRKWGNIDEPAEPDDDDAPATET